MGKRESDVRRDLGGHFGNLYKMVRESVDTYNDSYPASLKKAHSKRSRASLIHDHFFEQAAIFAEPRQDILRLVESRNLWMLFFQVGYSMRFKKVDEDRIAGGHITDQLENYRCQFEVEGIPSSVHLDLSYQLSNDLQLSNVYVICPSGVQTNAWELEITPNDARSVVVDLFPESPTDGSSIEGGKITPKEKSIDESESGNDDSSA